MTTALGTLSVICAVLYGIWLQPRRPNTLRTLIKSASILMLALLSWALGGPIFLTIALALGALGDAFLSRDGETAFLAGLGAFLLGHLAYIGLFVELGDPALPLLAELWRVFLCALLVILAGCVLRLLMPHLGSLKIPVLAYVAVILVMAAAALNLPTTATLGIAILGALMFVTSDAILAFEVFILGPENPRRRWTGPTLWFLYWGGQFLITGAVLRT